MININETLFSDLKSTRRVYLTLIIALSIITNAQSCPLRIDLQGNIFVFSVDYIILSLFLFSLLTGLTYFYHLKRYYSELLPPKIGFATAKGLRYTWDEKKYAATMVFWENIIGFEIDEDKHFFRKVRINPKIFPDIIIDIESENSVDYGVRVIFLVYRNEVSPFNLFRFFLKGTIGNRGVKYVFPFRFYATFQESTVMHVNYLDLQDDLAAWRHSMNFDSMLAQEMYPRTISTIGQVIIPITATLFALISLSRSFFGNF